jgi:phosphoribosylaminoimidazolecarboxamide formyltransferase / IMP cyclohydrolase
MEHIPVRRALLSVSDKSGLVELARALSQRGVTLVSTGGTAKAIADAGIDVVPIDSVTSFPEMLEGRVKTLHPFVHGGILADRDKPEHLETIAAHGIEPIDLIVVNLYPFKQTVSRPDVTLEDAIENIDIGGPAMVRSAAKNHQGVAIVVDPADYSVILDELTRTDGISLSTRRRLMAKAYAHTASYDAAIASYFERQFVDDAPLPPTIRKELAKVQDLRYGENPHQRAALYRGEATLEPCIASAISRDTSDKEVSFNNL